MQNIRGDYSKNLTHIEDQVPTFRPSYEKCELRLLSDYILWAKGFDFFRLGLTYGPDRFHYIL